MPASEEMKSSFTSVNQKRKTHFWIDLVEFGEGPFSAVARMNAVTPNCWLKFEIFCWTKFLLLQLNGVRFFLYDSVRWDRFTSVSFPLKPNWLVFLCLHDHSEVKSKLSFSLAFHNLWSNLAFTKFSILLCHSRMPNSDKRKIRKKRKQKLNIFLIYP